MPRRPRHRVHKIGGRGDPARTRAHMEFRRPWLGFDRPGFESRRGLPREPRQGARIARGKLAFPADAPKPRVCRLVRGAWTTPFPVASPAVVGFVAISSRDSSGPLFELELPTEHRLVDRNRF